MTSNRWPRQDDRYHYQPFWFKLPYRSVRSPRPSPQSAYMRNMMALFGGRGGQKKTGNQRRKVKEQKKARDAQTAEAKEAKASSKRSRPEEDEVVIVKARGANPAGSITSAPRSAVRMAPPTVLLRPPSAAHFANRPTRTICNLCCTTWRRCVEHLVGTARRSSGRPRCRGRSCHASPIPRTTTWHNGRGRPHLRSAVGTGRLLGRMGERHPRHGCEAAARCGRSLCCGAGRGIGGKGPVPPRRPSCRRPNACSRMGLHSWMESPTSHNRSSHRPSRTRHRMPRLATARYSRAAHPLPRERTAAHLTPQCQALLRSQSGPHAAAWLTAFPTEPALTIMSEHFHTALRRRLRLPLALADQRCGGGGSPGCGAEVDLYGDHRAACARSGHLARRAALIEQAWVRVCREALGGEDRVVPQQWLARTIAPGVREDDRRRLDLVVYGATRHGSALCCDVTLVSPLRANGHPHPRTTREHDDRGHNVWLCWHAR